MLALFKRAATKNNSWPYSYEVKSLIILSCSLFLAVSLFSYNTTDHSWFYYDTASHSITNWCGYAGACIGSLLLYLFGGASLLFIGLGLFSFYYYASRKTFDEEWDRFAAYGLLPFVMAALLAAYGIDIPSCHSAGGFFGRVSCMLLQACFDIIGAYIFLYTLLLGCMILIFRFSFIAVINALIGLFSIASIRIYLIDPICAAVFACIKPIQKLSHKMMAWIRMKISFSRTGSEQLSFDDASFWQDLKKIATPKKERKRPNGSAGSPRMDELGAEKTTMQNADVPQSTEAVNDTQESLYQLPQLDMFIGVDEEQNDTALMQELEKRAAVLQEKLERFDVFGKVTAIKRGPVVTLFEYQPQIDTKISKIIALEDDLALALQTTSIRIIAPIPGRSVVGFEVANKHRRGVLLAQLIKSEAYKETKAALPMILGVDTIGNPVIIDLARMPHLLMAGSTGSGKSVALNAMLISLLCKISPDDLRLVVVDPKRLEFAPFADIAHLLFPIVTDPKGAPAVLRWVVKQMEQRYEIMSKTGARNIHDYRANAEKNNLESMPFIVVIIDELADLMMCAGKEVEDSIIRITQMARAAGIHLIAATQRPSVDVITGLIKVNFPSRISFRVTSKIDSRTILDCAGADKLLGRGDMLFLDSNDSLLKRVHGAYVLDKEINQVIGHIRSQRESDYLDLKQVYSEDRAQVDAGQQDEMYEQICHYLQEIDEVSISLLQRRFRIGYNRSARIIDMLESQGLIAPSYGGKTRKVVR